MGENIRALEDAAAYGVPFIRFAAAPYWADELQQWKSDPERYWSTSTDLAVAAAARLRVRLIPDLLWNPFAFADYCHEPLSALYNRSYSDAVSCTRALAHVAQISEASFQRDAAAALRNAMRLPHAAEARMRELIAHFGRDVLWRHPQSRVAENVLLAARRWQLRRRGEAACCPIEDAVSDILS